MKVNEIKLMLPAKKKRNNIQLPKAFFWNCFLYSRWNETSVCGYCRVNWIV